MTSSWSRITDSSSRSIVQVCWCFSIVLFQRKSEGSCLQTTCSVGSWREKSVCPSPTNWTALCFGESYLAPPLTRPVQNALISSYWRSGSPSASHLSVRPAGRRTEEQNSSHDAQFVSHYLPVDCVEMCFCFLLPSRGSSPTCTSCSVGCVCGNCSISAGWMFSPPRMISSFRRPSQCSSNTDCSDRLCHWLHVVIQITLYNNRLDGL